MGRNPHTQLVREVELLVNSRNDARAWTNPVGFDRERNMRYGLCPGSLDLIGIQKVLITPEMVGQIVGVFLAFDSKTGSARMSQDQSWFADCINSLGGTAGPVRSTQDVERYLLKWKST